LTPSRDFSATVLDPLEKTIIETRHQEILFVPAIQNRGGG